MFNMGGRKKVESGDLCERKNGRGVDTNRNWDIHWGFQEKDYDPSEEYPGTAPFRCAAMPHSSSSCSRGKPDRNRKGLSGSPNSDDQCH